jgi:8-oxo-dGTP diphosphatase
MPVIIPRGAVSVCVQCQDSYLLVQRGKEPNKGMWSLPGGKLEYGEGTLQGGMRELSEEVQCAALDKLQWYKEPLLTTDSIGQGYHYLIAHCYAHLSMDDDLPTLQASDDAADAGWFTINEIEGNQRQCLYTPGILRVIKRMQELSTHGLLL